MRTKVTVSAIVVMTFVLSSAGNPARGAFFMGLGDLPGGTFGSDGAAISADGKVVVGVGNSALGEEAFRWTRETGMTGLGFITGNFWKSHASDVSSDGSVIVGHCYGLTAPGKFGWQPFRWTESSGPVGLGYAGSDPFNTIATGVSGDGSTVVG